jgi:transposase
MVMDRDVNAALNLAQYGRNELRIAARWDCGVSANEHSPATA